MSNQNGSGLLNHLTKEKKKSNISKIAVFNQDFHNQTDDWSRSSMRMDKRCSDMLGLKNIMSQAPLLRNYWRRCWIRQHSGLKDGKPQDPETRGSNKRPKLNPKNNGKRGIDICECQRNISKTRVIFEYVKRKCIWFLSCGRYTQHKIYILLPRIYQFFSHLGC